jgi:hypothetical protein
MLVFLSFPDYLQWNQEVDGKWRGKGCGGVLEKKGLGKIVILA